MAENTNIVLGSSASCKTDLGIQAKMTASATIQYYRDGYDLKVVLKARSHSLSGENSAIIDKGENWICYQFDDNSLPGVTSNSQGIKLGRSSYIKDNGTSGTSQYTSVDTVWTIKNIGTAARTITFYLYTWVGYNEGTSSTGNATNRSYNTRTGDVVAQAIPLLPLPEIFPVTLNRGIYQKLSGQLHYADKIYIPINNTPTEVIGGWIKQNGTLHQFWPKMTKVYTVTLYGCPDEVIWYSTANIINDNTLPYWQIQLNSDGLYQLDLIAPPSGSAYYFVSQTYANCTMTLTSLTQDTNIYLWPGVIFGGTLTGDTISTAPSGVTFGDETSTGESRWYRANTGQWYGRGYVSFALATYNNRSVCWVKSRVQLRKASGSADQTANYTNQIYNTGYNDQVLFTYGTTSNYYTSTVTSASYTSGKTQTRYWMFWGDPNLISTLDFRYYIRGRNNGSQNTTISTTEFNGTSFVSI